MANIELLDEVIDYIEEHPEEWSQNSWGSGQGVNPIKQDDGYFAPGTACGTAFCVAGHVANMKGGRQRWGKGLLGGLTFISVEVPSSGNFLSVSTFAQLKLGLEREEADVLFDASNTLEQIKEIRDVLANHGDVEQWNRSRYYGRDFVGFEYDSE